MRQCKETDTVPNGKSFDTSTRKETEVSFKELKNDQRTKRTQESK